MNNETNHVKVWAFSDAPEELQQLSPHGGDEDWLALIPAELKGYCFWWMDSGTPFGLCQTSVHELPDGRQVRIGAHA